MAAPSVCHQFATVAARLLETVNVTLSKGGRLQPTVDVTLDIRVQKETIFRDLEQRSELDVQLEPCPELDVSLEGRTLRSLQELDELLEESLRSSSHSQEKRNESVFASGIQDLVEPLPQITVSTFGPIFLRSYFFWKYFPLEHFVDDLLDLVVKFRTKLHIAFSTPDEYAKLLQTAIQLDYVGLAQLVVAMEPLRISNKSCLCPATVVAKVMKCASTLEVVTLLLEICRNPPFDQPSLLPTSFNGSPWWRSMEYKYADLFLKHIGTLPHFRRLFGRGLDSGTDKISDTMKWFGSDISTSYDQNQKLPGVWNLTAEVHGLLFPTRRALTYKDINPLLRGSSTEDFSTQVLKLQVSLQTDVTRDVTGACSMAIGVRNVQVRIQNASLDSSPSNLLGFFLSHITVSIRPEVEEQQVLLMLLDVPSPNKPYDISATRTIGVSATATGSKNPGVAVTATESSSATIKSTTTDWCHEQTRGDEVTGNFSWTLRRLAGVPFDHAQPKCTKMSIFRLKPVTSILDLPFNSDGSVTFSEQCPKTIQWTLAPKLAGTDVAWYVSTTVHVTMLDRSTGKGKTLEFWSPHHFLHNMSTDVKKLAVFL